MRFTKLAKLAFILSACAVFATGCNKKESSSNIKIGAILPLTGTSADAAEHAKRGIDLAITKLNASKPADSPQIEVVYGDSKNMAKDGLTVFNKMNSADGIKLFLATNSGVVVPLAEAVGTRTDVLLMVTISSAPDVSKKGPNIFRVFVTAENEARTMSKYLVEKQKVKDASVFYINDDFGLGGMREFEKAFTQQGGKIAWKETWEKGGSDFKNSLFKLPKNTQALYIIGYEAGLGLAVKQAREAGYKGLICTTVGMSVPPWRAAAGEAANGVYYTSTGFSTIDPQAHSVDFINSFKTTYGKDANSFAAFAYDSMMLLGKSVQKSGADPSAVAKEMSASAPQQSVLGEIKFDVNREADLPLHIWVFKDGKEVPVR